MTEHDYVTQNLDYNISELSETILALKTLYTSCRTT